MKKKKSGRRTLFDGPLGEPIVRIDPLVLALMTSGKTKLQREAAWRAARNIESEQKIQKLHLLARRYEIKLEGDLGWALLALKTAEECVPGFLVVDRPPRRRGRPKGTTRIGGDELAREIELVEATQKKGIKAACQYLTRHHKKWKNQNARSMATAYHHWKTEKKAALSATLSEVRSSDSTLAKLNRAMAQSGGLFALKLNRE